MTNLDQLPQIVAAIRELQAAGAIHVQIGNVRVTFAPTLSPEPFETAAPETAEERKLREDRLREQMMFYSAER